MEDNYDHKVIGIGNSFHPANDKSEIQNKSIDDILSEINQTDIDALIYWKNDIEREALNINLGLKFRIQVALDKLQELESYASITKNNFLSDRISKIKNLLIWK